MQGQVQGWVEILPLDRGGYLIMPAALRIGGQRRTSSLTKASALSGLESSTGSKPDLISVSWKSLSFMTVFVALAILSMIGFGVPTGANNPLNNCAIMPGTPASIAVGI